MISGIHIQGMPLIICYKHDIDRHILFINHKCVYLYQYKSIYRKCFYNDMQYLVMCSENIVRDNLKS